MAKKSKKQIEKDINLDNPLRSLVNTEDIRFEVLKMLSKKVINNSSIHYDSLAGMMTIYFVMHEVDSVVHYISDHVGLIYNAKDMECVGIQIEGI